VHSRTTKAEVTSGPWNDCLSCTITDGLSLVTGLQWCRRRFFDPRFWRVILVDQRGCGSSTPRGRLEARFRA